MRVRDARALTPGTALTTKDDERVTYVGYAYSPPMTFGPSTVLLEVRRSDGRLYFGLRPRDVEIVGEA
jgi:hypothetical protein